MKGETTMKKLAMKMLSLLLVLSLLLPTCVFAQPGQDGDGTPGTQSTTSEETTTFTEGGNGGGNADVTTEDEDGDENADAPTGGGNGDGTSKDENGGGNTKDVNGGSVTQSTTSEKTTTFTEGEDGDEDSDVSEEEEPLAIVSETNVVGTSAADDGLTDAERLEAYLLYSQENGGAGGSRMRRTRQKPLNAETQAVYDLLKTKVEAIIGGTVSNTVFDLGTVFTWTDVDLGTTGNFGTVSGGTLEFTDATNTAINNKIGKVGVDTILQRLLSEMPYELFWFDKAYGSSGTTPIKAFEVTTTISGSGNATSGTVKVAYTVKMVVAKDYASGGAMGGYDIDTSKITRVTTAKSNAESIKATHASATNYEKLVAYRNEICRLVAYDTNTYNNLATTPYGDPWQLINVFDHNNGDENAVVCEGYAKAFKYLCDLTWPGASPAVECYLVTGTMNGGTGAGPHMWNVVQIGGNNYLVDVTNCDTGTIGATDKLFLCGVREDVASKKYTATNATAGVSHDVSYEYDTQTINDYEPAELKLWGVKYTPPAQETPVITTLPTASGITYGKTLNDSTISPGVAKVDSAAVSGTFAWRDTTIAPEVKDSETTEYEVVFTPTDTASYENATCKVTLTVYAKNLTDVAVGTIADQGYTSGQISPAVIVTGDGGKTLVKDKDYTVDYGANNTVGTTAGSVTVKAKPGGNYTFGDKTVNFTIVAGTSTISITGNPGKVYDGGAVTDPSVNTTGSGGAVTYTYYTDAACTTETTAASGATTDGAAPKNAGDYWVKATLAADSNYGSASDAKKFTISQKDIGGATIVFGPQETYDGSAKNVGISKVTVDGKDLISTIEYTIKSGKTATDVGNTTLVIEGKGNYKGEASAVWSLQRATPTAGDFDIPGLGTGYDYNGNPWSVNAPTLKSPKTKAGEVTVYYKGTSGTTYPESTAAPTDVGSYSVTFNVAGGQNFNAASGLSIDTLKINKVNYTPPAVSGTVRSNQVTTNKTLELPALPAGASYTASGTVGGTAGLISSHSVSGTTLTYSTTNQMDGISATITIPVTGATNYNNYSVVVTVTAKDKDDAGVSITNGSSASVTYGETITISATKTASENGTWTWNYDTTVFDVVGANSESTITLKAMKATTAAVTVKATFESTNYMGNASIAVNVNQATPVAENFMFTAPTVLVYDGSNKTATVTAKGGITGMGAVTVKYFKDGSLTTDTKAVGTYVVKVNVAAGTNYAAISDLTAGEWTFTVTRANASVTAAPAAVGSLGYDGSAKNLITAGTCTGGTMNYRLGDSGAWGTAIPQATNAGTYTVWYKVVGDGNHNDTAAASVTVTIARQNITPSVTVSGSYTYNNGNPITPTVEVKNGGATLTAGTDYDVLVSDNTNAGTGKVTVKERADSNYTFTEVHKTFSIGRANQATLTVTGGTSVVYGETLTLGTSGGSGTGAVTYTVTDVTGRRLSPAMC